MIGHEWDEASMDEETSGFKQTRWARKDTEIGHEPSEEIKRLSEDIKEMCKSRRRALRKWEREFWQDLGKEATDAGQKGNQTKQFEIVNADRRSKRYRDTGVMTVTNAERRETAVAETFARYQGEDGKTTNGFGITCCRNRKSHGQTRVRAT